MVDIRSVDVVVIGGGPVGLVAAVTASERGLSTVVLERHDFHGSHGSSGGAERQWRLQYAESDLSALTLTAQRAWRELESRARRRLVYETGSLWFGDTSQSSSEGQIDAAVEVLESLKIEYDHVDSAALRSRFGFHTLPSKYRGIYQPHGGTIDVAATRWSLLHLARRLDCELHGQEKAIELELHDNSATIRTDLGHYHSKHVIVTAGPWAASLLEQVGLDIDLTLYELTNAYFRLRTARDYPSWFVFQNATEADSNLFYGFGRAPWAPDDLVQVSPLFETDPLDDPMAGARTPRDHDLRRVTEWVSDHMPDLVPEPLQPTTCLAALPSDHNRQFYLGTAAGIVPNGERLVVSAGGWGFKFVPVFGKACVDLAMIGRTGLNIERAGLAHFTPSTIQG